MKRISAFLCLLFIGLTGPLALRGQDNSAAQAEKRKAEEKAVSDDKSRAESAARFADATTALKVKLVLIELDGEKKTKSLPYVIYVNAAHTARMQPDWTRLRIGSRVPVYTGKDAYSYIDVGTSIDARANQAATDQFILQTNVERSWVEGEVPVSSDGTAAASSDVTNGPFKQPIIRQFKFELNLTLKDGQTIESTMATDPTSGKILRVETTLNIAK